MESDQQKIKKTCSLSVCTKEERIGRTNSTFVSTSRSKMKSQGRMLVRESNTETRDGQET
jgi:hypothetical protein